MKKLMGLFCVFMLLLASPAWATDFAIKDAPGGLKATPVGTEAIPVDDGNVGKYVLISGISTYVNTALGVDALITLSGVLKSATHLGTFTGTTIPDDQTIKAALQALESALEALSIPTQSSLSVDDLIILSGVAEGVQHLGEFTGSTIPDNQTIKAALQALETAFEALPGGHDAVTLDAAADAVFGLSTQQLTLDTQAANKVFAGPESGDPAAPTVRYLVSADIPNNAANTSGTAANLSGTPTLPNGTAGTTQSQADNSTKLATTAYVDTGLGAKAAATHTHFVAPTELTIYSGSITATQLMHTVDTEGDAATDNLDTIVAGSSGQWLYLRAEHTDRTVVIRHNQDNIYTGGQNISLTDTTRFVILFYDGGLSKWVVVNSVPDVLSGMDFAGFTPYYAIEVNASGYLSESATTSTELGYVHNVGSQLSGNSDSATYTNKTFDFNGAGNVAKGYGYITLRRPNNRGSATTAVTTTETDINYGMPTFADDVESNNYIDYFCEVPRDIDTAVDLVAWFKFRLGGADTADHDYIISMVSIANSAAQAGTPGNAINLSYDADASGASGDVETAGGDTLTDWKSNVTAGNLWMIRITRDGDDGTNDASTVDSYPVELTIRYGWVQ